MSTPEQNDAIEKLAKMTVAGHYFAGDTVGTLDEQFDAFVTWVGELEEPQYIHMASFGEEELPETIPNAFWEPFEDFSVGYNYDNMMAMYRVMLKNAQEMGLYSKDPYA